MKRYCIALISIMLLCGGCSGSGSEENSKAEGLWVGAVTFTRSNCDAAEFQNSPPREFRLEVSGLSGSNSEVTVTDQGGRVYFGSGDSDLSDGFTVIASDAGIHQFAFSNIGSVTADVTYVYGYESPAGASCAAHFAGEFTHH